MKVQYFEYAKFRFSYLDEGQGDIILVLGGAAYYAQTFSDNIKSKYRFIYLDHRGFAEKRESTESLPSMKDLIEDIESFRREKGLQNFYILGHSGHAYLALEYAKCHEKHIKGVIVLAAGPDLSFENRKAADQYFEDVADESRKQIHAENMNLMLKEISEHPQDEFKIFCVRSSARSSYDPELNLVPLWKDVWLNLDIVLHMWSNLFSQPIKEETVKAIKVPVLIIMGLFDFQVPPHFTWNNHKEDFQDLTFKIFPQSGHHPQLEESELFETVLSDWIAK